MNTKDAAAFLGKTTRQLQRYAKDGKISVKYIPGEHTRSVADYNEEELKALKDELENPSQPPMRPAVAPDLDGDGKRGANATAHDRPPSWAVALLSALAAGPAPLALNPAGGRQLPAVPLAERLTLSLAEAAELAGLSQHFLRGAIALEQLKAKKRGRGWNIKRSDLDAYVKKL